MFLRTPPHPLLAAALAVLSFVNTETSATAVPTVQTGRLTNPVAPLGSVTPSISSLPRTYRLGPGDRLKIEFLDVPEFSGEQTVLTDGTITLPRTGAIAVEGRSLEQVQELLQSRFSAYLLRPVVAVAVVQTRPIRVTLAGEVQRPGVYSLSLQEESKTGQSESGRFTGFPTLTTALQKAGGVSQLADLSQITLRRSAGIGQVSQQLDLWALIRQGDNRQDPLLLDGDIIEVKRVSQLNPRDAVEAAQANISPEFITVYVAGEVAKPGPVQIKANNTISQAILAAGGLNQRAEVRQADLVRLNPDGTASRQTITLDYGNGVDPMLNPPLRNYDAIVVYASTFTQFTDGMNRFLSPLTGAATVLRIFGVNF